jgi:endo-1,4-beta-mannosidase
MKTQFDSPVTLKFWWISGHSRNFHGVKSIERKGSDMVVETDRAIVLVNWNNVTVLEEVECTSNKAD